MSENIQTAIRAIMNGEPQKASEFISAELASKSLDAIAIRKVEIASNYLNVPEEETSEEK